MSSLISCIMLKITINYLKLHRPYISFYNSVIRNYIASKTHAFEDLKWKVWFQGASRPSSVTPG